MQSSQPVQTAQWLIIGGGIAGTVLARALGPGAVVLDPNPGRYRIGESVSPEQFNNELLAPLLPEVLALPSWSPKVGTTFVDVGPSSRTHEVASFPLARHHTRAMHVMRHELEALLHAQWRTQIVRERVVHIDPGTRTVTTDVGRWRSVGPVLDCSGPAMVVASALNQVETLWPVWAAWQYYDATPDDPAFWHAARDAQVSFLDVPSCKLLRGVSPHDAAPTSTTLLTRIDDGLWMWQIPLFRRRLLSVGVVSRHGPVSAQAQNEALSRHGAACWQLSPRDAVTEAMDLARYGVALPAETRTAHRRGGFARYAQIPATEDYVLVGDASAFADPVFSVGTSLAVSQAIHLAALLNRGPWTSARAATWSRQAKASFERAKSAFQFWYDGAVQRDDAVARTVQEDYLVGRSFRRDAVDAYAAMVDEGNRQAAAVVHGDVRALLPPALADALHSIETNPAEDSVQLAFPGGVLDVHRVDRAQPAWRRVSGAGDTDIGISYPGQAVPAEADALAAAVAARTLGWQAVLEAVATMYTSDDQL